MKGRAVAVVVCSRNSSGREGLGGGEEAGSLGSLGVTLAQVWPHRCRCRCRSPLRSGEGRALLPPLAALPSIPKRTFLSSPGKVSFSSLAAHFLMRAGILLYMRKGGKGVPSGVHIMSKGPEAGEHGGILKEEVLERRVEAHGPHGEGLPMGVRRDTCCVDDEESGNVVAEGLTQSDGVIASVGAVWGRAGDAGTWGAALRRGQMDDGGMGRRVGGRGRS